MADTTNDFAALTRQYLDLWGQALRGSAPQPIAAVGVPGLNDMLEAWTRQSDGQPGFGAALGHFSRQSSDWYAQMQQVAARFSGRDHSAGDVAAAWREAFAGSNPFAGLMEGMRGPGLESIAQWGEAGMPSLHGLRAETAAAMRMPAFGFSREHQERLQALALAQLRWQEAQQDYGMLMAKASRDAFSRFESKLANHEEPGQQINSVRALFDLWVEAAEESWAELALSQEYRHAFGALVNAQMRQRAAAQAIGEQVASTYGWPERGELDSAHRKIAELERQLRRMQRAPAPAAAGDVELRQPPPKRTPAAKQPPAAKVAPAKAPAKKAPAAAAAKKVAKKIARKVVKPAAKGSAAGANVRAGKPAARRR
ncbi:poly(R)-hydroxyalkanoic acid synthase subunit PhaE [Thermomonas fusca]|nr:poly(R)-hydroxyalkanoic acid synthase subunit PhaE [Thermomonas fusca]